jgi:hypothetical protein
MNSKLERMENKAIMAQLQLLFQHLPERKNYKKIHARWTASTLRTEPRIFRRTDAVLTMTFSEDN